MRGAGVSVVPAVVTSIATDAAGTFSIEVPVGVYGVEVTRAGYATVHEVVSVVGGESAVVQVALAPVAPVAVDAGQAVPAAPGDTVDLSATAEPFDGSAVLGFAWAQVAGVSVSISGGSTATPSVTLPEVDAFKASLMALLRVPQRLGVLGVNPRALQEASTVTLQVTVTTSSGTYFDTVDLVVSLPASVSTGIRNVPVGLPVLVQSNQALSYSWGLAGPAQSCGARRRHEPLPDVHTRRSRNVRAHGGDDRRRPDHLRREVDGGHHRRLDPEGAPTGLQICTDCHGAFDGGSAQAAFTAELQGLEEVVGAAVADRLNGLGDVLARAWDPATGLYSSTSSTSSNVAISLTEGAPACGGGRTRWRAPASPSRMGRWSCSSSSPVRSTSPGPTAASRAAASWGWSWRG